MNSKAKIVFRNILRRPAYSVITFIGFTLAIAASLIIYLWVYNEKSYDRFHPDYQRIYRVLTLSKQGNDIIKSPGCYRPVAKTMKMDYPQVEDAAYISYDSEDSPLYAESESEKIEARGCCISENFFRIFAGFRFIEGNPENAFDKPGNVVLSENIAKKIFHDQPALGKTLISDKFSRQVFTVSGVIHIPERSHIALGYVLSDKDSRNSRYSNNWGDRNWVRVYLKLRKDALIDSQFLASISNHVTRYSGMTDKLMFQPLADIHLHSDYLNEQIDRNQGSYRYVWIFSGLALLIIIMASLNFSVLSVARASERAVEIGIRKVNGSSRFNIFIQFLTEAIIQTFAATVFALCLVAISLPLLNTLSSRQLISDITPGLIFNLFFLTFLVGIVAGIYPSFFLSSFSPARIFRGGTVSGSRSNFIRLLVTAQFTITIFLIIITLLFIKQLNYIHKKDLGFDYKNVVVIPTGLNYDNKELKVELLRNPGIENVSASTYAPLDVGFKGDLPVSHMGITDTLKVNYYFADEDFAKTYKLEVIKGQFLQMTSGAYWEEFKNKNKARKEGNEYAISIPIVINETAEKLLGFDDPVGQRIGENVIVGVVKDFHFRSLHYNIEPLVICNNPEEIMTMNVRISPVNRSATLVYIRDIYRKNRENREFSYVFFEDLLNDKYVPETRLKNMAVSFSVLAIIISLLGILGMSIFSINRRTKEIGIRRVTGARAAQILLLLNREFLTWVIAAFIIVSPVAWYTMHDWLGNFVYKTNISWWIFAFAAFIAFGIALLTVNCQSWKTIMKNPVEALRYE